MQATGFTGIGNVFGRDRTITFAGGALTLGDLTLAEAQMLVGLLEKMPAIAGLTAPPQAAPRAPRAPAAAPPATAPPAASEPAASSTAPAADPPAAAPPAEPTAAEKKKAKAAAARKAKADKKAAADKAAADKAAADEPDEPDEPDPRQTNIPGSDEPAHDPETGEVLDADDEAAAIAAEAAEEREAIQAVEAEAEAAAAADTGAVPDEIKKAKHLRNVIVYLFEQGIEKPDDIVAWCKAHEGEIGVVKRVGAKLPDRVTRAIAIMST